MREDLRAAGIDALLVTHPPNVRYLTGLAATAGAVVVTPSRCLLFADFRYETTARSLVAGREPGALELIVPAGSYDAAVTAALRDVAAARIGVEAASLTVGRFNRLAAELTPAGGSMRRTPGRRRTELLPLEGLVEARRMVKDPGEIATLREAGRRIATVARELPAMVREGRTERAIAGDIEVALRAAGFERPAFETIVASGPNGALPHARPTDRQVRPAEGVVLDFGGVYDGYCVDFTRTVVARGAAAGDGAGCSRPSREAHAAAIAAVRPGVTAGAIDAAARGVLEAAGLGEAFGHGTGHGLGLEVHEAPRIARRVVRSARMRRLPPGWCSRSSRGRTSRVSAASGSRTTCWSSPAAATCSRTGQRIYSAGVPAPECQAATTSAVEDDGVRRHRAHSGAGASSTTWPSSSSSATG